MARRTSCTQPLTVTHAALRAAQGDYATARRILREVLESSPEDPAAWRLWREIAERRTVHQPATVDDSHEGAAVAIPAARLAAEFRQALGRSAPPLTERKSRLRRWLRSVAARSER